MSAETWQLTDEGREQIQHSLQKLRTTKVLLRERNGTTQRWEQMRLARLETGLTCYRYWCMLSTRVCSTVISDLVRCSSDPEQSQAPGSLKLLSGAHSTYHTKPPETRTVHGRENEVAVGRLVLKYSPMAVISGIAGCGKTTLTSHWLERARK